jgi:hypothetical protein
MKSLLITTKLFSTGVGNSVGENFRIPAGLWHRMELIAIAVGVLKGRGIHW